MILNAAAYTDVDRAETEPDLAFAINAKAPRVLAEEAVHRNALLVNYSTDYVFDGSKQSPWVETDQTNPLNVYGASKCAGESAIRQTGGNYLIFRTSWVYGPHGNNFLLTMLRLGRERDHLRVVNDQVGAPTASYAIAHATNAVVCQIASRRHEGADNRAGVYHMTCAGSTSWYGFASAIFGRARDLWSAPSPMLSPILSSDYPTAALRPKNSVLCNEELRNRFGVALDPWEISLDRVLQEMKS